MQQLARIPLTMIHISLTALSYFVSAHLGLWLASLPGDITPVWPPSGVALAIIIIGGNRMAIGVMLGVFCTELSVHEISFIGMVIAFCIALVNTLEPLLAAWLIRRFAPAAVSHEILNYSHNVFILAIVAITASIPSALIGTTTIVISGVATWSLYLDIWLTWWRSVITGIILFTPLLLIWQHPIKLKELGYSTGLEIIAFSAVLMAISFLAFGYHYAIEYSYLLLLMWSVFRLGRHVTSLSIVIISMMAVIFTTQGMGPFVYQSLNESLLLLQSFMASIALSTLFLSAVLTERRQALSTLQQYTDGLEQIIDERTVELRHANDKISNLNKELRDENRRMSVELAVTRQLQQMILPRTEELQQIAELDIAGFMESATEVGGDYYDVLQHNGHIKIGIGDVTGHGLASGVLMLMVQTAVRTLFINNNNNEREFLNILNSLLYNNLQRMQSDKNLTLSLLDYHQGRLRISGQHEEVLLVRKNGEIERIDTLELGFMLGIEPDIDEFITYYDTHLQPDDGVVLYTDGLTEARNADGKIYGIDRLCAVISHHWQCSAVETQRAIIADLKHHVGSAKIYDDITLLIIKQNSDEHNKLLDTTPPENANNSHKS
ncbi:MAG: MASE1 domain-containing protein [Thiotrichaceae bacterium]